MRVETNKSMSWISSTLVYLRTFKENPFRACSNKPVRKILSNPIDCPSALMNEGFNDSMSFTDAFQKNSRAPSGKSQSDNQQSPNYSGNCSFTMGHLYLERLSSGRVELVLPALVPQSHSSPANKIITLNRWPSQGLFFFCLLSAAVISSHIEIEEENIVETGTAKSLVCFA